MRKAITLSIFLLLFGLAANAAELKGTVLKVKPSENQIVLKTERGEETLFTTKETKGVENVKEGAKVIVTFSEKDGQPNRHSFHDLGQAAANLIFQATSLGLAAHQMGGFHADAARERFRIPEGWEPVSVIALGYPGNAESLPEALRERETAQRRRKPLGEFVFSGNWGHPASILDSPEKK